VTVQLHEALELWREKRLAEKGALSITAGRKELRGHSLNVFPLPLWKVGSREIGAVLQFRVAALLTAIVAPPGNF
jgi:hypothetical protein